MAWGALGALLSPPLKPMLLPRGRGTLLQLTLGWPLFFFTRFVVFRAISAGCQHLVPGCPVAVRVAARHFLLCAWHTRGHGSTWPLHQRRSADWWRVSRRLATTGSLQAIVKGEPLTATLG